MDNRPIQIITKYRFWILSLLIILVYSILRLVYLDTIQFGYDQPILASTVIEFIKHPTFIDSYRYVLSNPWGYPSWGPFQIFFYAIFLSISKQPITVSIVIAMFNVISVGVIIFIGKKFFPARVGIVAGIVLATHIWWVIFSRMIYQPTPAPTFIAISMLIYFYVLKNPKTKLLVVIPILWVILFQLYIHTLSFIIPGILLLIFKIKNISKKYLAIGLTISAVLMLPFVSHLVRHSDDLLAFVNVGHKLQSIKSNDNFTNVEVVISYFKTLGGAGLEYELGYGYPNFVNDNKAVEVVGILLSVVAIAVLVVNLLKVFLRSKYRIERIMLLAWAAGPLWFLIFTNAPVAPPRYFIISLPSFAILTGLLVDESMNVFNKIRYIFVLLVCMFAVWMSLLTLRYYKFILDYAYPSGVLSLYSDPPYIWSEDSISWMLADVKQREAESFTLSSDTDHPYETHLNWSTLYILRYLYPSNSLTEEKSSTRYVLYTDISLLNGLKVETFKKFGPYVIARITNN